MRGIFFLKEKHKSIRENDLNSKSITNINQLISTYSITSKGSKEIQLSEGVYIVSTSQYGGWDQTNKGFLVLQVFIHKPIK